MLIIILSGLWYSIRTTGSWGGSVESCGFFAVGSCFFADIMSFAILKHFLLLLWLNK